MNTSKFGNSLIWAALSLILTLGSASAQTSEEGVQLYKSGKYGPALQLFEALAKKQPTNALTHYYIALCAHGMNQTARATQEYQWVVNHSKGALKTAAQNGLDSVSRYSSGRTAQVAAGAADAEAKKAAQAEKTAAADKTSRTAGPVGESNKASAIGSVVAANAGKAKAGAGAAGDLKCKKIIEFKTSWDRECLAFEPTFEAAKSKYAGKIAFQALDAEDEANAALKAKYNVSSYPTLIYLDGTGKVLKTESGRPETVDAFSSEIEGIK